MQSQQLKNFEIVSSVSNDAQVMFLSTLLWSVLVSLADTKEKTTQLINETHADFMAGLPEELKAITYSTKELIFGSLLGHFSLDATNFSKHIITTMNDTQAHEFLMDYLRVIMVKAMDSLSVSPKKSVEVFYDCFELMTQSLDGESKGLAFSYLEELFLPPTVQELELHSQEV